MHELTRLIKQEIPVQKCDEIRLDKCVSEWMHKRLSWLEDGATSLDRIRKAFCVGEKKIIQNKIKCNVCKEIIESKYRHDFVSCKCGRVSVDGGKDYLRRTCKKQGDYEELSTYS
jgi:hypothetical protein